MSNIFTVEEVAKHASKADLYMIIHDKVYDVSSFVEKHPGGDEILTDVAGRDATEAYDDAGHSEKADKILKRLYIGDFDSSAASSSLKKPPVKVLEAPRHVTGTRTFVYAMAFLATTMVLVIVY
ncbi:cytochrome b5-like heme/steroid binding domain-containing protein [Trichoderma chlorosporum]